MARKPTGAVVEHVGRDGRTYRSLRFTAYGKRRFVSLGPVSESEANRQLRHVLADVERGIWQPPQAVGAPPEPEPVPTFHQLCEAWWTLNEAQLRPSTQVDYRWRLEAHLIPFFGGTPISAIDYGMVKRYIAAKLGEEDPLSARSVNMTLTLAAAIMEEEVENATIAHNPFKGKKRRAREHKPRRSYLDTADHIAAMLDAACDLDRDARRDRQHVARRAIVAVLVFSGLRLGELLKLRWRDVDLAGGWLHVTDDLADTKTDAGRRKIKIRGALRDVLLTIKPTDADPDALVFATRQGKQHSPSNVRRRVLEPAVERASKSLVSRGLTPLPAQITPRSLRRTFASLLYALGESPAVVMAEMGHTTPELALQVYAQAMRRDDGEIDRLRSLVEGRDTPTPVETGVLSEEQAA